MLQSTPARLVRARAFGKSPVNGYLRLNQRLWRRLPAAVVTSTPLRSYGAFLHRLVELRAARRQYFGTFFFRNRPQLTLISRLAHRRPVGSTLKMAFLGCSNGAELYSVLWTIRAPRPDLNVVAQAVDISKEILALAQRGVYSLTAPELVGEAIFARITAQEMQGMFDAGRDGNTVTIKPWLKDGVAWRLDDAASPLLLEKLGYQDMVLANNFLCHMDPPDAEQSLRTIARLVTPGGHLVVSGIDLDVRARVARDLGWLPVRELMEDIHDGDPSLRTAWPWAYWGLEPFSRRHPDWPIRYASVFQVGTAAERSSGRDERP